MNGLFVGDLEDYDRWNYGAIVSATKTIHTDLVGHGKGDPHYLFRERPDHLIFNWVDGPARLYDWAGPEAFSRANDFIEEGLVRGPVLVHCDAGLSRSPTVALVFMAKRAGILPSDSFEDARMAFKAIYPNYDPGGIAQYVREHWEEIK